MMPMSFRENFEFTIISHSSSVITDEDWVWFAPLYLERREYWTEIPIYARILPTFIEFCSLPDLRANLFLIEAGISGRVSRLQQI